MEQQKVYDQKLKAKEILTAYRNEWYQKLIALTIDQKWAEKMKDVYPNYSEKDMMTGTTKNLDDKINECKDGKKRARLFLEVSDILLDAEEKGVLAEHWSDEALKKEVKPVIYKPGQNRPKI